MSATDEFHKAYWEYMNEGDNYHNKASFVIMHPKTYQDIIESYSKGMVPLSFYMEEVQKVHGIKVYRSSDIEINKFIIK